MFNRRLLWLLLLLTVQTGLSQTVLSPYELHYRGSLKGISATLVSRLEALPEQQWQLHNKASALFISFDETSRFRFQQQQLTPLHYQYRDEEIHFDWQQRQAQARDGDKEKTIALDQAVYDMLSYQIQLRMDLQQAPAFSQRDYWLASGTRVKQYRISREQITELETPAGRFKCLQVRMQRPGKSRYTRLWLAIDHAYMPVQMQRFEEDKAVYKVELTEYKDSP